MGLESTSISQCMTKNVKTIKSNGSLFNVCKIMKDNKIGCVVVVNEFNDPVGIITERDIINNLTTEDADLRSQVVTIMTNPIITLLETNSIMDALQTMTTLKSPPNQKIYPLINFVVSIFNSLNQLKNKIMINLFIFSDVNQLLNQVKQ